MSRQTIKLIDLMCDALNWNGAIKSVQGELDRHGIDWFHRNGVEKEVQQFSKRRDRKIAKIREVIARLSVDEKQRLIRDCEFELKRDLASLGIDISDWWPTLMIVAVNDHFKET